MVGVDLLEIPRIEKALRLCGETLFRKVFTKEEAKLTVKDPRKVAAVFAAKEAVIKVLGTKKLISWSDLEIIHEPGERPKVVLHRRAKQIAEEMGLKDIILSKSDTENYVVVVAMGVL